jgi:hypothetical protein
MSKRYRDYGPALLALAGSGLLLAVLLWQWLHYRGREADLKSRLAAKVEVRLQAAPKEEQPYALPGLEAYAATVERPLFMESRRPAEADAGEPPAASAPKRPLTAKLMGVVFAPGQKPLGLFVDARGKYKRLRSDDPNPLDGWTVVGIEADKAILEQDGTREELKLAKPRPKRPPTPPPGTPGAPGFPGPAAAPPAEPFPGQPPPFDPNNPEVPQEPEPEPVDVEQPNPDDPVDEIPVAPEEAPPEQ